MNKAYTLQSPESFSVGPNVFASPIDIAIGLAPLAILVLVTLTILSYFWVRFLER